MKKEAIQNMKKLIVRLFEMIPGLLIIYGLYLFLAVEGLGARIGGPLIIASTVYISQYFEKL